LLYIRYFGQAGTTFDFANQNFSDVRKRLEQLEEKQNKLGKNVNRKVMDMLDRYFFFTFISFLFVFVQKIK